MDHKREDMCNTVNLRRTDLLKYGITNTIHSRCAGLRSGGEEERRRGGGEGGSGMIILH